MTGYIQSGSIEVLRGVGQNSSSMGKVFGAGDRVSIATARDAVKRLTGVTLGEPRSNPYPPDRCLGVWSGVDADGKHCTVKVWVTDD